MRNAAQSAVVQEGRVLTVTSVPGKDPGDSSIVSVVLPCYNAASTIAEQLQALEAQRLSEPWEVVVVDNRSTDESMAIVGRYTGRIPGLRVVKACERVGRSYARNAGVNAARGSLIAFCDADDVVGTGWLAAIRDALIRFDCVACCVDYARLNPASIAARHADHKQRTGLQKAWYPPFFSHAGGGTLAIRRALHEQIGGFDETFAFLEDTEYCFRVQKAGCQIEFVAEAIVHVRMRPSMGGRFHQIRHWARYNVLLAERYRDGDGPGIAAWKPYLRNWLRLAKTLPKVQNRLEWEDWVWHCGWQVGVLQGVVNGFGSPVALRFGPRIRTVGREATAVWMMRRLWEGVVPRWRRFWVRFAGPRGFGRIASRFASVGTGPYHARASLSGLHPRGFVAHTAWLTHPGLSLGAHVYIGDNVIVRAGKDAGDVDLNDGVQIYGDAFVHTALGARLIVGRGTHIQPGCTLNAILADIRVGQHVEIAPRCAFYSFNHGVDPNVLIMNQELSTKGPITIGDGAWLGHGVIVLSGVHIGTGAVIGAGSVVLRDIPPYAIAVGNPARVVGYRDRSQMPTASSPIQ